MKRLLLCALLVTLGACSQADAQNPRIGQFLGKLTAFDNGVYEFRTPSGAHCVALIAYGRPSLSCDFSK